MAIIKFIICLYYLVVSVYVLYSRMQIIFYQ